jgi:hypothetical protein
MPQFTHLNVEQILVADFNPARRINRSQLSGLMISIQQHGILEPLALTWNKVLADGHRRLACAKLLGMKIVPVSIHDELVMDAPALWVVLNAESMSLTPSQWLDAVSHGLPLSTPGFPESMRKRIAKISDLLGESAITDLVEAGRSPNIIDTAERVVKYCGRKEDREFLRQTLLWLILVGNSFSVRAALSEEIPDDLLVEAIEHGNPIHRIWDVER